MAKRAAAASRTARTRSSASPRRPRKRSSPTLVRREMRFAGASSRRCFYQFGLKLPRDDDSPALRRDARARVPDEGRLFPVPRRPTRTDATAYYPTMRFTKPTKEYFYAAACKFKPSSRRNPGADRRLVLARAFMVVLKPRPERRRIVSCSTSATTARTSSAPRSSTRVRLRARARRVVQELLCSCSTRRARRRSPTSPSCVQRSALTRFSQDPVLHDRREDALVVIALMRGDRTSCTRPSSPPPSALRRSHRASHRGAVRDRDGLQGRLRRPAGPSTTASRSIAISRRARRALTA